MKTFAFLLLLLAACGFTAPDVRAVALVVTTPADSGAGSLRDTITGANDGDTIQFAAALNGQTITLTTAKIVIDRNLMIDGPGASQLTVQRSTAGGTPLFRIFDVTPEHTVTITGLTISNGITATGGGGGGIYNNGATLTITNCTISGNSSGYGGAIINNAINSGSARLVINNSILSGNSAANLGGGIYNIGYGGGIPFSVFAAVEMNSSTISGNSAGSGAGIYSYGANEGNAFLQIQNSTISGNLASVDGGGIYNDGTFLANQTWIGLSTSTLSGNSAAQKGGAIMNNGD